MSNLLSFDTETTGLSTKHGAQPFLVTTFNGEECNYWEWDVDPLTRKPIYKEEDLEEIYSLLYDKDTSLILQNAKFDIHQMTSLDWEFNSEFFSRVYDTLLAAHLINSSKPHGLTESAMIYLGIDIEPYENRMKLAVTEARKIARRDYPKWRIAKAGDSMLPNIRPSSKKDQDKPWKNDCWLPRAVAKEKGYKLDHLFWRVTADYANIDSEVTYRLFERYWKILEEEGLLEIYEERLKLVEVVYEMEQSGIPICKTRLKALEEEYLEEHTKVSDSCINLAKEKYDYELSLGKKLNNSVREFCFNPRLLNLPIKVKTETGSPSLNKDAKEDYLDTLEQGSDQHNFVKAWALREKIATSLGYMDSYRRFWIPQDETEYLIYSNLNPTGTATLRWASENPNQQQISKQKFLTDRNVRYCFGPSQGREWYSLDYDNLELRLPAYECQEPAMVQLFERPNDPPYFGSYHLLIFDILYPKEFKQYGAEVKDKFKDTLYQWTKNGNFAEMYGAVDRADGLGTADRAFHFPGAQSIVATKLRKKASLNNYWVTYANDHGYVETMPDRALDCSRGYPLYCARNEWNRISPTIPLNYHIQGTACWVINKALVKVYNFLKTIGPEYRIILQVHDELVFDFPKSNHNQEIIFEVRDLMESCGKDVGVPLTVGIDLHENNWSQGIAL